MSAPEKADPCGFCLHLVKIGMEEAITFIKAPAMNDAIPDTFKQNGSGKLEGPLSHTTIIEAWKVASANRIPLTYKQCLAPLYFPAPDDEGPDKEAIRKRLHELTPIQAYFRELERATIRATHARPYPHIRQGCTGKLDEGHLRPAPATGRIHKAFHKEPLKCPVCKDKIFPARLHRSSNRVYHPGKHPYTEIAGPGYDRAYIYRDYHGDLICSHCDIILEYNSLIKTRRLPENLQKPDNSDHRGNDGGERGRTYDPLYGMAYIKKLQDLEPLITKMDPDKDRDKIVDSRGMKKITSKPNMEIGKYPTLNYCTKKGETWGQSWYGRALVRTDPNHPKTKHLFCLICWKANEGKPYRNSKSWHHIRKKQTKQNGYNEQAVLTAIAADPGKSKSDIANYCQTHFVDGKFSIGNVSDIIEYYRGRGMVYIEDVGYKNTKRVY